MISTRISYRSKTSSLVSDPVTDEKLLPATSELVSVTDADAASFKNRVQKIDFIDCVSDLGRGPVIPSLIACGSYVVETSSLLLLREDEEQVEVAGVGLAFRIVGPPHFPLFSLKKKRR